MMNGIDVSAYQPSISMAKLTTTDFVIVKATQGTSYTNEYFKTQIESAIQAGKRVGAYHYANGTGYKAEADYFISVVKPYLGKVVLALDWETGTSASSKNSAFNNVSYAKQWLDYVKVQTGVTPVIYLSESVAAGKDWSSIASTYKLWGAQYPNYNTTDYKSNPWMSGGWGSWGEKPTIFQYTSSGRIAGYSDNLDLNLFYGSASDWDAMTKAAGWKKNSTGWWYQNADGTWPKSEMKKIDGYWYYFNSSGYVVTDTTWTYNGTTYTADSDGRVTTVAGSISGFGVGKTYTNGSTSEPVFADTGLTVKTGSLDPYEVCECLDIVNGRYLVKYIVNNTTSYKTGFVKYSGGVTQ